MVTRSRTTLQILCVLALAAACGGLPVDPTPARDDELIVDVHAHAFTALHLPISGFVAAYSGGNAHLGRLVERLVLLEASQDCEPEDARFEQAPVDDACVARLELARAASPRATSKAEDLSGDALDLLDDDGFARVQRCRVELRRRDALATGDADAAVHTDTGDDTADLDRELDELLDFALGELVEPPAALARLTLGLGAEAVDAVDPLRLRATLDRFVRLVWTLTRSSDTVAECLRETYPAADLTVAQMLDMQAWFPEDDDVCRPVQTQIADMRRVMEDDDLLGALHGFLPYDPRRDVEQHGAALEFVRRNIGNGFLGVKLYPPMGFRASRNGETIAGEGEDPPHAELYDAVLEDLYAFCVENDLPITAHCNPTGAESSAGRGKRSNPRYWVPVLERHPSLRLDLGHFGGHDLGVADGWSETIGELFDRFPNVYADLSYTDLPADEAALADWQDFLARHPAAAERLMYGSDWPMILREPDGHAGLSRFLAFFEESFPDLREAVFGRNALRFLGLLEPTPNRGRLLVFYERVEHGFRPPWWRFTRPSVE